MSFIAQAVETTLFCILAHHVRGIYREEAYVRTYRHHPFDSHHLLSFVSMSLPR
jgi:hypothetical protein